MILRVALGVMALASWSLTVWFMGHECGYGWIVDRYSKSYTMLLAVMAAVSLLATLAQFGFLYRWLHHRRAQLALFCAATVVSLVLAELAVRVLDPLGISYYVEAQRYDQEKVPDDDGLVYTHRPGFETVYYGKHARFNELGLRGPPIPPRQNQFRILVLGDSVVAGLAVAEEDTFVHHLQGLCKVPGRTTETINSGVGSYNTVQQGVFLRRHVDSLDPDLVMLLYVSNDVEPAAASFNPERYSLRNTLSGKSPPWVTYALLRRSQIFRLVDFLTLDRHDAPPLDPQGVQQSMQALQGIARECRTRDIPFALFLWRMHETEHESQLAGHLADTTAEAKVPFVDVLPWFDGEDPLACRVSVVDSHPNERGHRILAEGMATALREAGLLDGP